MKKKRNFITVREYISQDANILSVKVFKLVNTEAKKEILAFADAVDAEGINVSEVSFDFPNLLAIVKYEGGYENSVRVSEIYINRYEYGDK